MSESGPSDSVAVGARDRTQFRRLLLRAIVILPDLVAPALAGFAAVAVAFLVIGAYRPFLVLPVAGAAAAALALATSRTIRSPGRPGPTVLAGAIAFVSWATNTIWSGQYLDSNLDPGTYANAGLWLRGNPTLRIPAPFEVFGSAIPSLIASAPGWPYADGNVYAQGNHGLPALLAAGAWIGGTGGLFRVNALLGAATLLALFALARRLVPGWWAVLPVIVLAVSQPFISIARAQYSEPLAAVCILGGLALTAAAVDRARPRAFALAGFVTGAACLARPDCYLAGVAVIVAAAAASRDNNRRWAPLLAGLGGWAVPAALGTLDLLRLSPRYIDGLGERIGFQLALLAVSGVGAAVAIIRRQPGAALPPDGSRNPPARHRNRAAVAAAGTILLVAAGLASRPLWLEQHVTLASPGMAGLQRRMGLPIDPSRSYGELSVTWHSWYFGWPVIAVGVIGLAALTADAIRRARRARAGILAAGLVYSAAYLARPSINGFHVWAMRRFVPLVIPMLLIGCAFILAVVARRSRTGLLLASGAAVVAIAIPALVTVPLFTIRDNTPALAQFRTQCAAIGDRAAVISLDLSAHRASRTLIGLCGSVAVRSPRAVSRAELVATGRAARAADRELFLVASSPAALGLVRPGRVPPTTSFGFTAWREEITRAPHHAKRWRSVYWFARVLPDGSTEAVPPPP